MTSATNHEHTIQMKSGAEHTLSNRELGGVLPVVQTPFRKDELVDHQALESELEWVLAQGVAGVTTGMVSEILRLTGSERREVTETVVGVARRHGALSVVSCGAESTVTAIALARHAEAQGADAVMVNPPLLTPLDDADLLRYYSEIVDATTIGVVVQDASGYIGTPLSLTMQRELQDRFPDRLYFKPEASPIGPRLSMLRDLTDGRARIIEGTGGAALLDSYRRGIVGTMPGAEVCWAVQRLWDALGANEWPLAYSLSGILNTMIAAQPSLDAFVAVEKHLLVRQGVIPDAAVRTPVGYLLDAETRQEVDRLADRLRELVDGAQPVAV